MSDTTPTRAEQIAGLRALAVFLADHPDVQVPDLDSFCLTSSEARAQFVEGLDAIEIQRSATHPESAYMVRRFGPIMLRGWVRLDTIGETVEVPSTAVEFTPYTPAEIMALATEAVPA